MAVWSQLGNIEMLSDEAILLLYIMCPRRESNPHRRCGRQDFKSCVSTSSTTRAKGAVI